MLLRLEIPSGNEKNTGQPSSGAQNHRSCKQYHPTGKTNAHLSPQGTKGTPSQYVNDGIEYRTITHRTRTHDVSRYVHLPQI